MEKLLRVRTPHCELNLVTLTLSDKRLQDQFIDERAASFSQLFWWAVVIGALYVGSFFV